MDKQLTKNDLIAYFREIIRLEEMKAQAQKSQSDNRRKIDLIQYISAQKPDFIPQLPFPRAPKQTGTGVIVLLFFILAFVLPFILALPCILIAVALFAIIGPTDETTVTAVTLIFLILSSLILSIVICCIVRSVSKKSYRKRVIAYERKCQDVAAENAERIEKNKRNEATYLENQKLAEEENKRLDQWKTYLESLSEQMANVEEQSDEALNELYSHGVLAPTYRNREPVLVMLYYLENGHADTLKEALNFYLEDLRFQRLTDAIDTSARDLRNGILSAFNKISVEIERQGSALRSDLAEFNDEALIHTKGIEDSVRTLEYYETMKMLNGYYG